MPSKMATYLVIWVTFALPSSPSLESLSSGGMINVNNCMMMKLLMNGSMPSANNVPFPREPPVTTLMTWSSVLPPSPLIAAETAAKSRPGTGM